MTTQQLEAVAVATINDGAAISLSRPEYKNYLLDQVGHYNSMLRHMIGLDESSDTQTVIAETMKYSRDTTARQYLRFILCAQGVMLASYPTDANSKTNPATRQAVASFINESTSREHDYTPFIQASTFKDLETGDTRIKADSSNFPMAGQQPEIDMLENFYLANAFEAVRNAAHRMYAHLL